MAEEDKPTGHQDTPSVTDQAPAETAPVLPPAQTESPSPSPTDRADLIHRARAFLTSPQVRNEDVSAKRRFLVEKGLTDAEIDGLLYEVPPPAPPLPPRTYPQLPPSKVPYLLLNVFRAFTWLAGGSAALVLAYFRFIYPKIARTYQARLSLRAHRSARLERLTHTLQDLKAAQRSTFAVLPQPELYREPAKYVECHGLAQLSSASNGEKDVPHITLLRCAIEDCSKEGRKATSAELFGALEAKFAWVAEEDARHEEALWRTLTTTPLFQPAPPPPSSPAPSTSSLPPSPDTIWTYTPPSPQPPPPLLSSLSSLQSALPPPSSSRSPPAPKFQHTLQALSDLTGYIATQTYALPHSAFRAPGVGLGTPLSPEEEEVRREIRALKGLVLNRRSFMPRIPRPGETAAAPSPA